MPGALADFIADALQGRAGRLPLTHHPLSFLPGDRTLVVSFMMAMPETAAARAAAALEPAWGEDYLRRRGHTVLGVGRTRNDWYLCPELHAAMQALADARFFQRYERVVFYGGSMGGFGALSLARLAPGCIVIAHNPQTSLHPALTPWETRYATGRSCDWNGPFADAADGAALAARVYVSYDPWCKEDRLHVERLPRHNLVRLRVPCVGHQMPMWLTQLKLLGKVFEHALENTLTEALFRDWARARTQLGRYWLTRAQHQRRPAQREWLGERARSVGPGDPQIRAFLWALTRGLAPAPDLPRRVFWASSMADAQRLHAALQAACPATPILLDPFHDPRRGYDLQVSAQRASHRAMLEDEINRHLHHPGMLVLCVTPSDPATDLAWVQALARHDAVCVLATRQGLDPDEPLAQALAQTQAFRLLAACLAHQGLRTHRMGLDGPMVWPPDAAPPDDLAQLLQAVAASCRAPCAWPAAQEVLRLLRPGSAQPLPTLALDIDTEAPGDIRLDPLRTVWAWGETVVVSGLVPPSGPAASLRLRQGEQDHVLAWHQSSPGGPHHFPAHPGARRARFAGKPITADAEHAASLCLLDQGRESTLARLRFTPMQDQGPAWGLLLAPWSIGYVPVPATGALTVCAALLSVLPEGGPAWPADPQARWRQWADWRTEVSGAEFKLSVVCDPVDRFVRLHQRWLRSLGALGRGRAGTLDQFVAQFDAHLAAEPSLGPMFRSQAACLSSHALDEVFAVDDLARLQQVMRQRWGLDMRLPAPPEPAQAKGWLARLGLRGPRVAPVSAELRATIQARYADDVALLARARAAGAAAALHSGPA